MFLEQITYTSNLHHNYIIKCLMSGECSIYTALSKTVSVKQLRRYVIP
jgi:hypothetical protein